MPFSSPNWRFCRVSSAIVSARSVGQARFNVMCADANATQLVTVGHTGRAMELTVIPIVAR